LVVQQLQLQQLAEGWALVLLLQVLLQPKCLLLQLLLTSKACHAMPYRCLAWQMPVRLTAQLQLHQQLQQLGDSRPSCLACMGTAWQETCRPSYPFLQTCFLQTLACFLQTLLRQAYPYP
jgi:hypothetical protein